MNKREQIIEAAKVFLIDNARNHTPIFEDMADFAIKHALSREAELHDEITQLKADLATAKQGLEHYADTSNWQEPDANETVTYCVWEDFEANKLRNGYTVAQQTLDAIGKE